METTPVSGASPPSSVLARSNSNSLGKDDFLKLLMAQMSYQDPMSPMDTEQMMQQMTQLGTLEQLTNLNSSVQQSLLNDQIYQQSLQNQLATTLIGKRVRSAGSGIDVKAGEPVEIGYRIDGAIANGTIEILDSNGKLIKTIPLSTASSGDHTVSWNGVGDDGQAVAAGTYSIRVKGYDVHGSAVTASPSQWNKIDGVVYRDGTAYLISGTREIAFSEVREVRDGGSIWNALAGVR